MYALRVLREGLPTFLPENRLIEEDRGRRPKHDDDAYSGES